MLTALALLALHAHSSDPFARFAQFSKSHPIMKVSFTDTFNGRPETSGVLLLHEPMYDLLMVKQGADVYKASSTPDGYLETDTGDRVYDESGPGGAEIRGSRISGAPDTAPSLIFFSDLHRIFKVANKITPAADGDQIYVVNKGMGGSSEIWVTINEMGEISNYRIKQAGNGKVSDRYWSLQYTFPSSVSPSEFALQIPLGYQPFALPRELSPLQKGKMAPLAGWKLAGGQTVNLLDQSGRKPFLLAVVDGQKPSQSAFAALHQLKSKLPVALVGPGLLRDPDGTRLQQLSPPGYPMFYLVDGSGKILNLWLGFDPAKSDQFQQEVTDGAKGIRPVKQP
jgi:hypothetical protein